MDCDYAPFQTLYTKIKGDAASLNTSITTGDISGAVLEINNVFGQSLKLVDKWKQMNDTYKPLSSGDSFIKNFIAEETADKVGNILPDLQHQYTTISTATSAENKQTVGLAFIAGVMFLALIILWVLKLVGIGRTIRISILFILLVGANVGVS